MNSNGPGSGDDAAAGGGGTARERDVVDDEALRRVYLRHTPELDRIAGADPALPGYDDVIASHRRLASVRVPGSPLVDVRAGAGEPDMAGRVTVEIVTDDMPFLVDSVRVGDRARRRGRAPDRAPDRRRPARRRRRTGRVSTPPPTRRRPRPGRWSSRGSTSTWRARTSHGPPRPARRAGTHARGRPRGRRRRRGDGRQGARRRRGRRPVRRAGRRRRRERPAARRARRAAALADRRPLHVPRLPPPRPARRADWTRSPGPGSACCARTTRARGSFAARRRTRRRRRDAGDHPRQRAEPVLRPVHPYYLARRATRRRGRHASPASTASSACSPSPRCYESVLDIPVVERRVRGAIQRPGFPLESYSGQQMLEVISGLPREELFSAVRADAARHRRRRARRRPGGARCACSCAPTRTGGSCPAWSTCRATATRRRPGWRWPTCCSAASAAPSVDYTARVSRVARSRSCTSRCTTDPRDAGRLRRRGRRRLQDELTEAVRTWDDRLLVAAPAPRAAVAALLAGVPEAYKAGVEPDRAPSRTCAASPRCGPGDFDVRLYPRPTATATRRFTLYLAGAPATLTAVLPVLQQLGRGGARRAPVGVRAAPTACAAGSTTSACAWTTPPGRRWPSGPRSTPSAVLRGVQRGLARRRRVRPVLRAGAARRAAWREVGGAARLRPLRPPARQPVRRCSTWPTRCWRHPDVARGAGGAVPGPVRPGARPHREQAVEAARRRRCAS